MSWLILITLGAIWGSSCLFIKVGGAEIPPFTFVEGRTLIAALALLVAMRWRGETLPRTRREWLPLIAMGIFQRRDSVHGNHVGRTVHFERTRGDSHRDDAPLYDSARALVHAR